MQTSPRARGRENPGAAGSQALRSAARDPRIKFVGGLGAPRRAPRIARALGATVLALLAACAAPGGGRMHDDLDPSLAFDVSDYGHLGYDAARGRPSERGPVQQQYRGTWDLWQPPNGDPGVARFLADKVVESLGAAATLPQPAKAVPLHRLEVAAR